MLPPEAAPYLGILAQIGVVFYLFVVGLEFDVRLLAERGHAALAISHASILAPFLSGLLLALAIYSRLAPPGVTFTAFALFLGVAMSITAFPVLARILTDRGLQHTPLGMLALCCAAVDDATAWCLLALVVGVATAHAGSVLVVIALAVAYVALMLLVVRPLLARFGSRLLDGHDEPLGVTIALVALLLSAAATEWIGIHAIFGGFLLGVVIPHQSRLARRLAERTGTLVNTLLLPAFFALTGLRTEIGLLGHLSLWMWCGADHPGGHRGQGRRYDAGRPGQRFEPARSGEARRIDEHSRSDGIGRLGDRPRSGRHLADALHDDGHHGAGHHASNLAGA